MTTPFNWCFIGTGKLAGQAAREICASGRHRISAVYSRRIEAARAFAAEHGGEACLSPEAAIAKADAVYVVTPHPSHAQYVALAISLGKSVLCEKPFTVKASETKELFRQAQEKGVYIVEGMWTWFAPVALKVRDWVQSGALGKIQSVITNYRVHVLGYAPRLTDPYLAGGALLDSGVYPVTYLYNLFGMPQEIRCTGVIENGIDLSDEIDMVYPDHTHHISLSICDKAYDESLRIIGSESDVFVDRFHFANMAQRLGKDGQVLETFRGDTTLLNEFDHVAQEIREGRKESAYVPAQATCEVMELLDACREQIGLKYPFENA